MSLPKIVRARILKAANKAADEAREKRRASPESIRMAYRRVYSREYNRAAYAHSAAFRESMAEAGRRWRESQ